MQTAEGGSTSKPIDAVATQPTATSREERWAVVEAAAQSLKQYGFINYFGEQRFQAVSFGGIEAVRRTHLLLARPLLLSAMCAVGVFRTFALRW